MPLLAPVAEMDGEVPGEGNGWFDAVVELGLEDKVAELTSNARMTSLTAP
jgi:hypothetical protein